MLQELEMKENSRSPSKMAVVKRYFDGIRFDDCIIVDVGGRGYYYDSLSEMFAGGEVILVNIEKHELYPTSSSLLADALNLPFDSNSLDAIVSFDTIEHLVQPDRCLEEIGRVLKANAWLVIATPNLADFYSRIVFLFGYMPFNYSPSNMRVGSFFETIRTDMGHKSVFTYKALRDLLARNGFGVRMASGYSYADDFYLDIDASKIDTARFFPLRRLLNRLLPNSMKEGMVFICQKRT